MRLAVRNFVRKYVNEPGQQPINVDSPKRPANLHPIQHGQKHAKQPEDLRRVQIISIKSNLHRPAGLQ
jgi:hypothetical protein